jgi:hypothetical protein
MTKPQALPFLVPFAAWFFATGGWREALKAAAVGLAVIALSWAPFVAAGGVAGYARNLAEYQGDIFAILSLRAWNVWWLVQEVGAGGAFLSDQAAILGPITLRHVGYAVAGVLELAVFLAVLRAPTPRTLALGLAAAVLVAFSFLTTMHERYAFGALVFLVLLVDEPRIRGLWLWFGVVFTLNLVAAIPWSPEVGALIPISGTLGVTGSIAITAITVFVLLEVVRAGRPDTTAAEP